MRCCAVRGAVRGASVQTLQWLLVHGSRVQPAALSAPLPVIRGCRPWFRDEQVVLCGHVILLPDLEDDLRHL